MAARIWLKLQFTHSASPQVFSSVGSRSTIATKRDANASLDLGSQSCLLVRIVYFEAEAKTVVLPA